MPDDDTSLELLVDIPTSNIQQTKKDFEDDNYEVKVAQQGSGLWSLAATKKR